MSLPSLRSPGSPGAGQGQTGAAGTCTCTSGEAIVANSPQVKQILRASGFDPFMPPVPRGRSPIVEDLKTRWAWAVGWCRERGRGRKRGHRAGLVRQGREGRWGPPGTQTHGGPQPSCGGSGQPRCSAPPSFSRGQRAAAVAGTATWVAACEGSFTGGGMEGHSPEPWKGRLQSQDAWVLLSPEPLGATWMAITCPLPQGDTEGSQAGQGECMNR